MTYWRDSVTGLEETITYDNVGNRTRVEGNNNGAAGVDHVTEFDAAGRVLTLRDHGAVIARYTYDAAGNRATYTADGATTVYRYDAQHRPLSAVTAAATASYGVTAADTSYQGGNGVTVRLTVMEALQVIAYKQYQDSTQWSRIAAANGLTSFTADAGTALGGRTLAIPHEASITW